MSQVSYTETALAVIKGIKRARNDYLKMAGDITLEWPEDWVKTYIAKQLWKTFGDGLVTVESLSDGVLTRKKGRPSGNSKGARYDIVLWKRNGTARAVIELKHQQPDKNLLIKDVKRIIAALESGVEVEFGALVYYYDVDEHEYAQDKDDARIKTAREKVKGYRDDVLARAKAAMKGTKCCIDYKASATYIPNRPDKWVAGCLIIRRKQGVSKK